jgi:hypothetical protein
LIESIPKSPGLRSNMVMDHYKDEPVMKDFLLFYHLLREVSRAEFKRASEFRRHVKMTSMLKDGPVEIDIDTIHEYYRKTRTFVELIRQMERWIEVRGPTEKPDLAKLLIGVQAEMDFNRR